MDSPSPTKLPWETPALYPARPLEFDYGYLFDGTARPCTQEELLERFSRLDKPEAALVWTPESQHFVLPMEVPFLLEANKARRRIRLKAALQSAGKMVLMWGGLTAFFMWNAGGSAPLLLVLLLIVFAVIPGARALWGFLRVGSLTFEDLQEDARYIRYSTWSRRRRSLATPILCAGLILLFGIQWYVGFDTTLKAAALVKTAVWEGQWWRLITGTLLHGNIVHIAFNGMFLIQVGREMEGLSHPLLLPIVFLFSAVCGSVASLFLLPGIPSVGASGGLLGLIGFLTILGVKKGKALPSAFQYGNIATLVLISGIGLLAWNMIDNAGHLGGAFGGAFAGLVFINRDPSALPAPLSTSGKILGVICSLLIAIFTGTAAWLMLKAGHII